MRARTIAALGVMALVVSVVTFQAVTARPLEPYVRLVGDGRPPAPWIRTECRDGNIWRVYTTSKGEEIDLPTSAECRR